jgi:hypothetical protein
MAGKPSGLSPLAYTPIQNRGDTVSWIAWSTEEERCWRFQTYRPMPEILTAEFAELAEMTTEILMPLRQMVF